MVDKFHTFPVNQQWFQVHALCYAATSACHLTHGICLDHRKTFCLTTFDIRVITDTLSRNSSLKESNVPQVESQCREVQRHLSQEMKNGLEAQSQCRHLQGGRRPWILPHSSMVGQQRQQISELQFDKFPTPSPFLYWKIRFKNQVTSCSDFPSEAMLWIKEVEIVDSVGELKSSRSIAGKNFPNLQKLDAKIASALNNIIQNSHFKKKVIFEEQESPERGSVSSRKTDRFHDLRLLSSHWRSWHRSRLCWFILYHSS